MIRVLALELFSTYSLQNVAHDSVFGFYGHVFCLFLLPSVWCGGELTLGNAMSHEIPVAKSGGFVLCSSSRSITPSPNTYRSNVAARSMQYRILSNINQQLLNQPPALNPVQYPESSAQPSSP